MTRQLLSLVLALSCLCGVGVLTPPVSCAAEPTEKVARIGFVSPGSHSADQYLISAFWNRLHELGWVRGQNLIAEERWAEGRNERLPELMAEVLGHKIDVLFTWTTPAAMAAKSATSTTPIVDGLMGDPVGTGLAASLAHPGGNLTGLSIAWSEGMAGKWLELLHEMVPRMSTVAVIVNPDRPISRAQAKRLEAAAPARDLKVHVVAVPGMRELDRAFGEAARTAQAVLVIDDPNLNPQRQRVVALAAKYRLPDMHVDRYFVEAGGLMSYAPDFAALFRRAADYVDKILKGAQAAELPIEEPTQYQLIVNLKTAKALGITIPESILLRADEVIR